jgi:hypothetical protein
VNLDWTVFLTALNVHKTKQLKVTKTSCENTKHSEIAKNSDDVSDALLGTV